MQAAQRADDWRRGGGALDRTGVEPREIGDLEGADAGHSGDQRVLHAAADADGGGNALKVRLEALIMQHLDHLGALGDEGHQG